MNDMSVYADSSYLLQFLTPDFASTEAISLHRRLGCPGYAFVPLHDLEIPNALRLKMFASSKLASTARSAERRSVDNGFRRLDRYFATRCFRRTPFDWEKVALEAQSLSERFTPKLGSRSLDLLHIAAARLQMAESFITCDRTQAATAKAAGLKVTLVRP